MTVSSTEAVAEEVSANAPDVAAAPSSSAEPNSGVEKSFSDVVLDVLKDPGAAPAPETGKEQSTQTPVGAAEDAAAKDGEEPDLAEEEVSKLSARTQRRIRFLVDQVDDLGGKVEKLAPKAEQLDKITGFLKQHRIEPQEFDNTLAITSLVKSGRYAEALQALEPVYQELQKRTGRVLPPDLQEQVAQGQISQAHAQELHANRVRNAEADARQKQEAEASQRSEQQRQFSEAIDSGAKAVTDWETQKARSDPDWKQKQPLVQEQFELILLRAGPDGIPKTSADAVAMAEAALKQVEERLKKLAPKPQVERRAPNGRFVSPGSQSQPQDFMSAVRQALKAG